MSIIFEHVQRGYEDGEVVLVGNPERKICRFCRKSGKVFNKRAHSMPEFLGNKTIFTLDECDDCNAFFGQKIEPDLKRFIGPSVFHNLKGKKGWPISEAKGGVKINSSAGVRVINITSSEVFESKKYKFTIRGERFSCLKVYKGFVKILLSIMPNEYLSEFEATSEWLLMGRDFKNICHTPWLIFGQQSPDLRKPNLMHVCLVRHQSEKAVVYQLVAEFNSIKIVMPFSPSSRVYFRVGEVLGELVEYKKYFFEWIDFSNSYTRKDFNFSIDLSSIG